MPSARLALALAVAAAAALAPFARGATDPRDTAVLLAAKPKLAALGPNWAAAVAQWACPSAPASSCDPCGSGASFWSAWPHIDCRTPGASAGEKAGGGRVSNVHFTESADGGAGLAPVVDALCGLTAAKEFDVSPAKGAAPFTGPLPADAIAACFPALHKLKANFGALSGPLPAGLTTPSYIKLNDNAFDGAIPTSWAGNRALFWVDVSNNRLTGGIPPAYANHPSLGVFLVAGNGLSGDVLGLAGAPLQVVSVAGNGGLCGPVPASVRWAKGYDATGTRLGAPCNGTAGAAA